MRLFFVTSLLYLKSLPERYTLDSCGISNGENGERIGTFKGDVTRVLECAT